MAAKLSTGTRRLALFGIAGMVAAGFLSAGLTAAGLSGRVAAADAPPIAPAGAPSGAPSGARAGAITAADPTDRAPTPWRPAMQSREAAERAAAQGRDAERARVDAAQDSFYADQSTRSKARAEAFENKAADYYKRP